MLKRTSPESLATSSPEPVLTNVTLEPGSSVAVLFSSELTTITTTLEGTSIRVPSGIDSSRRMTFSSCPAEYVTFTPAADATDFPSSKTCCTVCVRVGTTASSESVGESMVAELARIEARKAFPTR